MVNIWNINWKQRTHKRDLIKWSKNYVKKDQFPFSSFSVCITILYLYNMKWKFKRARGNSERGKKDFNLNSNFFYYPFSSSTNTRRKEILCVKKEQKKINFLIWFYFFLLVLQSHIYILILLKFRYWEVFLLCCLFTGKHKNYASNFLLGYYLRKKWGLLNYVCWLKLVLKWNLKSLLLTLSLSNFGSFYM